MENNKWNKSLLRSIQYWFEDGIVEIVMGGMLLLLGIYFYLQVVIENSKLAEGLSASFTVLFIGAFYLMQYFIRSLKKRITYPRSGYLEYRKGQGNRTLLIMAVMIIIIMTVGLLVFSQKSVLPGWNLLPIFSGLVVACVLGLMGFYASLPRFYRLAGISLVLGGVFTSLKLINDLATSAFYGAIGVVLVVSGSVILVRYLRQNPSQAEGSDDK